MAKFPNKMYVLEKFGWEFISKKSYFTKQSVNNSIKNSKNMGSLGGGFLIFDQILDKHET